MRRLCSFAVLASLLLAGTAGAQEISFGVRAGATFPAGSFGDSSLSLKTGWNVGAVGRINFGTSRFGAQLDVGYSGNGVDGPPGGTVSDWQAGVALTFLMVPMSAGLRPYLLLGGGIDYWQDVTGNGIVPALYGGAGADLRLDPIMPYAEVQYRMVLTPGSNLRTLQLIFGLRYLVGYR
jgi:hypothetical protein